MALIATHCGFVGVVGVDGVAGVVGVVGIAGAAVVTFATVGDAPLVQPPNTARLANPISETVIARRLWAVPRSIFILVSGRIRHTTVGERIVHHDL